MTKTLSVVLGCGAAAAGGIGAWYLSATHEAEANLQQAIERSLQQTPASVTFVVTPSPDTPPGQTLYISGSGPTLGNWEAAGVPLTRSEDGTHRATVELLGHVQYDYKVTRGTWGAVERGPAGEDIPNRTLEVRGDSTVVVEVASWIDKGQTIPGRITIAGELRVHRKFRSDILGNERDIAVWLPPGYRDGGDERYPVLYVHDGQNLFNEATAYAGVEWRLDETAQRLIGEGMLPPIIIVGIYNTPERAAEFDPAGKGDAYGRFIVEELKPHLDRALATRPGRDDTAVAGAGLGGLITLHMAARHPAVFGRVAALSPWLRVGDKPLHLTGGDLTWARNARIWLDLAAGGGENFDLPTQQADLSAYVAALGVAPSDPPLMTYHTWADLKQDEAGWASTMDRVLLFLFQPLK